MKRKPESTRRLRSVRTGLLREAYRHQPFGIPVALVTAFGIALLGFRDGVEGLWLWFGLILLLGLVRLAGCASFIHAGLMHADVDEIPAAWRYGMVAGQIASGMLWALLVLVWIVQMHEEARYASLVVLSALAGGATGVLAPLDHSARIFISLLLLPLSAVFLLADHVSLMLAFLALFFWVMMLFAHGNNHRALRDSLRLGAENADLVHSLRLHTREIEALNLGLEEKVRIRTEALERVAETDILTKLPNRRWLLRELDSRLGSGEPLAVLLLDLVRFKQINNRLGHEAGDQVLRGVADRICTVLDDDQALVRWGGDEFILLAGGAGMGARQVLQNVRKALAEPVDVCSEPQQIDLRVGVAVEGMHGETAAELLGAADLALAELKRVGRGYFLFYRNELASRQRRRLDLAFDIQRAGEQNELHLVYQPIVSALDGRVQTLEALLRWDHPRFGSVPPDEFIPLVEDSAVINALGDWVLRRACSDAMCWSGDGPAPGVAVNVSVIQLRDPLFVQRVSDVLGQTGLPSARLDLEVTESVFEPHNAERVSLALAALSAMGIRIHVDDFGTGYSSLSRLHELPIDAIKIDRSFVAGLDAGASAIIEGAILIARRFGLNTIAEGVETLSQAVILNGLGVDCFQGYFIAGPQAVARLAPVTPDWLETAVSLPGADDPAPDA